MRRLKKKTPAERAADARLGALIRLARQILGWHTLGLGVEVGVTNASISTAERGLTPWPKNSAPQVMSLLIRGLVEKLRLKPPEGRLTPKRAEKVLALLVAEAQAKHLDVTVRSGGRGR